MLFVNFGMESISICLDPELVSVKCCLKRYYIGRSLLIPKYPFIRGLPLHVQDLCKLVNASLSNHRNTNEKV